MPQEHVYFCLVTAVVNSTVHCVAKKIEEGSFRGSRKNCFYYEVGQDITNHGSSIWQVELQNECEDW
jgi:hypothetical protein